MKGIKVAKFDNLEEIVNMALELWPDNQYSELEKEFIGIISNENEDVLLYQGECEFAGFIHIATRNDYVEGADFSPTGFIEGIFVKTNYRKQGIAKALVKEGENWAKEKGCKQMGSDVELDNKESIHFHKCIGYNEVNRVVCFLKDL